ncbi:MULTISPECIES: hypothetical protein [Pseudomonas]|nr:MULTISPECIES: hypothetical protein [Pseudomonas]MDH0894664.1 hypothetical protein [Pseudomonas sp. GD03875]MDH1067286.1 hypothetical protein [Pseudomonas sp. GD03985]
MHDETPLHRPSRREALATLATTGLTLGLITLAGYYAPSLLALAAR